MSYDFNVPIIPEAHDPIDMLLLASIDDLIKNRILHILKFLPIHILRACYLVFLAKYSTLIEILLKLGMESNLCFSLFSYA